MSSLFSRRPLGVTLTAWVAIVLGILNLVVFGMSFINGVGPPPHQFAWSHEPYFYQLFVFVGDWQRQPPLHYNSGYPLETFLETLTGLDLGFRHWVVVGLLAGVALIAAGMGVSDLRKWGRRLLALAWLVQLPTAMYMGNRLGYLFDDAFGIVTFFYSVVITCLQAVIPALASWLYLRRPAVREQFR